MDRGSSTESTVTDDRTGVRPPVIGAGPDFDVGHGQDRGIVLTTHTPLGWFFGLLSRFGVLIGF